MLIQYRLLYSRELSKVEQISILFGISGAFSYSENGAFKPVGVYSVGPLHSQRSVLDCPLVCGTNICALDRCDQGGYLCTLANEPPGFFGFDADFPLSLRRSIPLHVTYCWSNENHCFKWILRSVQKMIYTTKNIFLTMFCICVALPNRGFRR